MTTPAPHFSKSAQSFVVSSSAGHGVEDRIGQIPRADVLHYVREMCVTLAYMSITYRCEHLADLLRAAAREAERDLAANDSRPQVKEPA